MCALQLPFDEEEPLTWEEFLDFIDEHADARYEYIGGFPHMMGRCSRSHSVITSTVNRLIGTELLNSSCEAHQSDMMLRVNEFTSYMPDVMVSCDGRDKGNKKTYVEYPICIVEVLSPSTRKKDRTIKFRDYFSLSSVHAYMLVDSEKIDVYLFQRGKDGEIIEFHYGQDDTFSIDCIGISFCVADIYRRVSF